MSVKVSTIMLSLCQLLPCSNAVNKLSLESIVRACVSGMQYRMMVDVGSLPMSTSESVHSSIDEHQERKRSITEGSIVRRREHRLND